VIVIDASVALAWFLEPEESSHRAALRYVENYGGVVPGNFQSEVVHGLLRAERLGRVAQSDAQEALDQLLDLSLDVDLPDPRQVMLVARDHQLTGYDAAYLAVALRLERPLASADNPLRRAAQAADLLWEP
jgi:predicted nucleic acid-binding protein